MHMQMSFSLYKAVIYLEGRAFLNIFVLLGFLFSIFFWPISSMGRICIVMNHDGLTILEDYVYGSLD